MNRHAIYLHEENRRGTGLEGKSPECSPDKCLGLFSVSDTPDSLISCYFLSVSMLKLPWWLNGKESTCQCRRYRRHRFDPWVGEIPWWRKWQPTPVFVPGKSHGQRSLVGYIPWDRKRVGHDLTTKQQQHLCLLYFLHLELLPSTLLSQFIPILQSPYPISSVAYFCYRGDYS